MNQKSIIRVPDAKPEKQTRLVERIVVVGYSGNKTGVRNPLNRKVLVSLIAVALVILAMLPVRTMITPVYGWYRERPLIVWVADYIHEKYFIWDPAQTR